MNSGERIVMGIVMIALVTTLILPGRQTAQVAKSLGDVFTGGLRTAMGR